MAYFDSKSNFGSDFKSPKSVTNPILADGKFSSEIRSAAKLTSANLRIVNINTNYIY
jgi:hypothetical protein